MVRHGFHSRLAVRRADIDPAAWPESRALGDVEYLEVGWGDRDFYPKPDPSLWDALDTIVRRTPAALHVGGFDPEPPQFLSDRPMVRIPVTERGLRALARFIHDAYERDPAGRTVRIRPGYYPRSWFYAATGRYHALTHNSNHWAAQALRAAGVPVDPATATTAGALLSQACRFGTAVGAGSCQRNPAIRAPPADSRGAARSAGRKPADFRPPWRPPALRHRACNDRTAGVAGAAPGEAMADARGFRTAVAVVGLFALTGCAARREGPGAPGEGPAVASPDLAASTDPATAGERGRAVVGRATVRRPVLREYIPVVDLKDIHFDFDRAEIRPDAAQLLDLNADWLRRHPRFLLLIEGHADERGTPEYNLALGERRARNAMNYLVARGVAADRITVISYGEDRPLCRESTEACWAENRRAHFAVRAP